MKPGLSMPNGRLRPAVADDLGSLVQLLHDKDVRRYLCDDTELPRKTVSEMLASSEQLDAQGLGLWVIEQGHMRFAGIGGLQPVSEEVAAAPAMAGGIEALIALKPEYWGRGLAVGALNTLIRYARVSLRLPRLVAAVDEPNTRSRQLMRRCGFEDVGRVAGPANELVLYELPLEKGEAPS